MYFEGFHDVNKTTWGDLHRMKYPNIPFTRTFLKLFYDREVRASGNFNTVNVAGFKFSKFEAKTGESVYEALLDPKREFAAGHSANLKIISPMNGTIFYSIDTGVSESIFSENYFNMNERHLDNDLYRGTFPF